MNSNIKKQSDAGFTLVELALTLLLSAIISATIFIAYLAQNRVYSSQDAVAEMQQNVRAAITMLIDDIRMAGYDINKSGSVGFVHNETFSNGGGLTENVVTSGTQISFTADLDEDGTIDEAAEDINGDGNTDITEIEQISYRLNGTNLQRYSTTTGVIEWQTIAEQIDRIEFRYLDSDGNVAAIPGDIDEIVEVQVSILGITDRPDETFTNTQTYTTASGANWVVNDNFRRRLLITSINCRNLGL